MDNWQDVMIEKWGPKWLKESYNIKEIGDLAEKIVSLQRKLAQANERIEKLRDMGEAVGTCEHSLVCWSVKHKDGVCDCHKWIVCEAIAEDDRLKA